MEHTIIFEEGVKIKDVKKKSKKEHGCIVKLSPSKKYLGKSAKINKKALVTWVESISYFIPKRCTINLEIYKGMELKEKFKYKSKSITELLKSKLSDETLSSYYDFSGHTTLEEDFQGERKLKRDLDIQFVFVYTNSIEPWIDSYCNYINTTSGGVHLESVKDVIWRYLTKKTTETFSDKEKEKYKVLKVDVEAGLNLVVNMSTNAQMQFVGQTKNEVSNDELAEPIKEITNKCLDEYFRDNKAALSQLTKIVKTNCKARIDLAKIKTTVIKEKVDKFSKHKMDKYTPCNNDGNQYKEIHLCEGDSAGDCLVDGRDPDTQAFYRLRGMTANPFKKDEGTILQNKEWYDYVTLLKTNFGPKFDLNKMYFDKVIIESDADIDGHFISSSICAFHMVYLPEIVKAGRLYKAVPPLYKIDDKNKPFVRDKHEYTGVYNDRIVKNYKVYFTVDKNKKPIQNNVFKDFIYDTQDYPDELIRLSKHFGVNKFLIEIVTAYFAMTYRDKYSELDLDEFFKDSKKVTKLLEAVQKKYPEITLSGHNSLRGIIDGRFQSISINNRFKKKVEDLIPTYINYGYSLMVSEKESKFKEMSIGEFLDAANKFKPTILTRYKGLGEMNSKQLWETTLNPDTRILIQLTMDDCEKEMKIFEKLHGQTPQNLVERKDMMAKYKIKREDLDN